MSKTQNDTHPSSYSSTESLTFQDNVENTVDDTLDDIPDDNTDDNIDDTVEPGRDRDDATSEAIDSNGDDSEVIDTDIDDHEEEADTIQSTSHRVNTICETEECADIEGVNLKDMCDFESPDCFEHMKQFVANYDPADLSFDMQNIMTNLPDIAHIAKDTDESKQVMHRFENLLMLKMFKRLKWIEKYSHDSKSETEKYYKYQKMYINGNASAKKIHEFNLKSDKDKTENQFVSLVEEVMTPHKMSQELLTYELLHYRPDVKVAFNEDHLESIANQIKFDLNRFNLIIQPYLEDRSWTLNFKDTLNFSVPTNKVIFSNTINTEDQENNTIITHMDMIINFIKRRFKVPTLKYVIVEDNKYYFTWILISIGYYPKKIINDKEKSSSRTSETKSKNTDVEHPNQENRQNMVRVVPTKDAMSVKQSGIVLCGPDHCQQADNPTNMKTTNQTQITGSGVQNTNNAHRRHRKR